MNLLAFALVYILILNLIGFLICGADKSRAKKGRWRISESTLLLVGLCGGCFGLLLGMSVFRHKTKHLNFKILAPLECVLWAVIVVHIISVLTLDKQVQYLGISDDVNTSGKQKKTALTYTMNCPESGALDEIGCTGRLSADGVPMKHFFVHSEMLISTETWQFDDYGENASSMFDIAGRKQKRDPAFSQDCAKAFELGQRLVSGA